MGILAAARQRVRSMLGWNGGFEAASGNRRLKNFVPTRAHINALISASGPDVLSRARFLVRNNGYARNAVEAWVGNAVGTGITPVFKTTKKASKKRITALWEQWVKNADADGIFDFFGIQRRIAREVYVAGEVFVRIRSRRPDDGLSVPMQLQVLSSEMLPLHKNEVLSEGRTIRQGIEFDAIGRRVAYHFLTRHPGDIHPGGFGAAGQTTRVPASEVIHLMDPEDAGQLRGVSRFAPAIVKLFLLDVYDDAELDRKKVAALHALFVTSDLEDAPYSGKEDDAPEDDGADFDLQPGLVVKLKPGEDIKTSSPADSGSSYEPFQYRTLLQVSAATGIPYAVLTKDTFRSTYSSERGATLEFRRQLEGFQHMVLVHQFCRAVISRFIDVASLSGAIFLPNFDRNRDDYLACEWLPPKWDWIDPWRDAKAEVEQINAGLKSRTQSVAERGYDIEKIDDERAAEQQGERDRKIEKPSAGIGHNGGPPMNSDTKSETA